tara:strand:- start:4143 stop:4769 length:627 start_codon:yes stop_codon:yes gene_type:complete
MAVPTSGNELSLRGIRRELETNNYSSGNSYTNISLSDCSDGTVDAINTDNPSANRPSPSSHPFPMSEFYGYDHDFAPPSFSSVIDNFFLSTTAGGNTTTSTLKTFTLSDATGNLTATLDFGISGDGGSTVQISMSDDGDPGVGGTGNNATGYVNHGSTATISSVSSGTIYVRYRLISGSGGLASTQVTNTFTCGGVTDEVTLTCTVTK